MGTITTNNVQQRITVYDFFAHPIYHYIVGFYLVSAFNASVPYLFNPFSPAFCMYFLALVFSWALSDVISYVVHMFIDSEFYDQYLTGSDKQYALIDEHHTKPLNYSQLTDIQLCYVSYPMVYMVMAVMYAMDPFMMLTQPTHPSLPFNPFYASFRFWIAMHTVLMPHAHKWAHERAHDLPLPPLIKQLQDWRILLTPQHHQPHHKTLKSHYSLYNGFAQLFFDRKPLPPSRQTTPAVSSEILKVSPIQVTDPAPSNEPLVKLSPIQEKDE